MVGEPITAGVLSALLLEGIKWLIRTIKKDPAYDFDPKFYAFLLPILNALMPFVMFYVLGMTVDDPILKFQTWMEIVRYLLLVVMSSLISVVSYTQGIKPLKGYAESFKMLHQ